MNRLKQLRTDRDMSLRALADKTGIDFSTLAFYERGQRNFSVRTQALLADFFHVSVDYLLGVSPEEMYEKMVRSLKDFYKATPDYLALSDEVTEPLRSKLELLFLIDELQDPESLRVLLDLARLRSAQEDFS